MDVLIIGSGGREHAIALSLKASSNIDKLYCAPGNGGIAEIAQCVELSVMDFAGILDFLNANPNIQLTVVAPDNPLAEGLVDLLEQNGHRAFGPSKKASRIESSKVFAKQLMQKYNIPTADYKVFNDYSQAQTYLQTAPYPLVIKADGLAYGKGVLICPNHKQALQALKEIMLEKKFGHSGANVIIEEFLQGKEVSVLAFCDGHTIVPMLASQDHKKAFDNDLGPNTGGMGAFCPSLAYTEQISTYTYNNIIIPTLNALATEGCPFKGVLYFGLMLTSSGVKVLEYNARLGDPEAQVVLPLLKTDLLDIMSAIVDERLASLKIEWHKGSALCVIIASAGYPSHYQIDKEITISNLDKDITLYHAGTKLKDGKLVTCGGRVLGVGAVGADILQCRSKVYANIDKIKFENLYYRSDIGVKV